MALARTLRELPETAAAFGDGLISEQHAQAIAGLTMDIPVGYVRATEADLVTVAELRDAQQLRSYLVLLCLSQYDEVGRTCAIDSAQWN